MVTEIWDYINSKFRKWRSDAEGRGVTLPEAQYLAVDPELADGEYHHLTLTVDGKLRTNDPTTQAMIDEAIAILEDAGFGNEAIRDMLVTVQADLDNPAQYRADLAGLAEQATLLLVAGYLDEEITAIIAALVTVQADLNNPNQYKANVDDLALEATVDTKQPTATALTQYNALIAAIAAGGGGVDWDSKDPRVSKGFFSSTSATIVKTITGAGYITGITLHFRNSSSGATYWGGCKVNFDGWGEQTIRSMTSSGDLRPLEIIILNNSLLHRFESEFYMELDCESTSVDINWAVFYVLD